MRNLFGNRSYMKEGDDLSDSYKRIEISSIDRVVRGQATTKFLTK